MTRPERKRGRPRTTPVPERDDPVTVMVESLFKDELRGPRVEVTFPNTPGSWDRAMILDRYGIPDHFRVWVREPGRSDRIIQSGRALW